MTFTTELTRRKVLFFATACMLSAPAVAQELETPQVSDTPIEHFDDDLDLGELFDLDMEVTVASKKSEKISDAPGVVVAYSAADMERLGYYTIRDLAQITTGYSAQYNVGEQTLETRGRKSNSFDNNQHLLMVDGIPVRHARAGKVPVEEEMSLYGTKRVEFMKGPGSALYGAGAYSGVINVVSHDLDQNGVKAASQITYGTDNHTKNAMGYFIAKNDNGQFRASVSYFDKESQGEELMYMGEETDGTWKNWSDRNAISVNMNYTHKSGLGTGFIYNKKTGGLGEFWANQSSIMNDLTWETGIGYLKFNRELTDVVSLNSYVLGNQSTEKAFQDPHYTEHEYLMTSWFINHIDSEGKDTVLRSVYADTIVYVDEHTNDITKYTYADAHWEVVDTIKGGSAGTYERQMRNLEALVETSLDFEKAGSFILGVNYDLRKLVGPSSENSGSWDFWEGTGRDGWPGRGVSPLPESDLFNMISFYLQYQKQFPVLSGLKLTAGFREDISIAGENKFSQFSPRIGIVQKFTDFFNWKVLYGSALRAPGGKEVGINNEAKEKGVKGVPDLAAETITSYESSINFSFPKMAASIAGFYNETSDDISELKIGSENLYQNSKNERSAWGVEFDIQAMPIKYLKLLGGVSYAETEVPYSYKEDGTINDIMPTAVPVTKANGAVSYISNTRVPVTVTPVFTYTNKYYLGGSLDDDKSFITNQNGSFFTMDLNMDVYPIENFGLAVQVKNITDNQTYLPADLTNVYAKSAGRSVNFSLKAKF